MDSHIFSLYGFFFPAYPWHPVFAKSSQVLPLYFHWYQPPRSSSLTSSRWASLIAPSFAFRKARMTLGQPSQHPTEDPTMCFWGSSHPPEHRLARLAAAHTTELAPSGGNRFTDYTCASPFSCLSADSRPCSVSPPPLSHTTPFLWVS